MKLSTLGIKYIFKWKFHIINFINFNESTTTSLTIRKDIKGWQKNPLSTRRYPYKTATSRAVNISTPKTRIQSVERDQEQQTHPHFCIKLWKLRTNLLFLHRLTFYRVYFYSGVFPATLGTYFRSDILWLVIKSTFNRHSKPMTNTPWRVVL